MALNSQLIKFKAPGTKILTEIVENIPQPQMVTGSRILVINSRKGPVNQLVRVGTYSDYIRQFDDISDADERRGNWSARSVQYALTVAPVYVINLRRFDDLVDKAGYQEISSTTNVKNAAVKDKPYSKLFNTAQFWKIDPEALISNQNTDKLLIFGNIGTSDLSVYVRKTKTNQSNITFDRWYKNLGREMPSYVNPLDEVSSWFVDVVIFRNNFGAGSSANISYGYCFNSDGSLKKEVVNNSGNTVDALSQLTTITESGYVGTITGSMVQGFLDDRGHLSDITSLVNAMVNETGLLVARNEVIFDNAAVWYEGDTANSNEMKKPIPVDFKGHNLCNINEVGGFDIQAVPAQVATASYKYDTSIVTVPVNTKPATFETVSFTEDSIVLPDTTKTVLTYNAYVDATLNGSNVEVNDKAVIYVFGDESKPSIDSNFVGFDGNLASVTSINYVAKNTIIRNAQTSKLVLQPIGAVDGFTYGSQGNAFPKDPNGLYFVYPVGHPLSGKPVAFNTAELKGVYHMPDSSDAYFLDPISGVTKVDLDEYIDGLVGYVPSKTIIDASLFTVEKYNTLKPSVLTNLIEDYGSDNNVYKVTFDKALAYNNVDDDVALTWAPKVYSEQLDSFVDANNNRTYFYTVPKCFLITSPDSNTLSYHGLNLKAYKARQAQFIDGTAERQGNILDVLTTKSLKDALSNRDLNTWNYIVDCFKSFVEPNIKYQLKDIAESRIVARAIYNMPSISDFQRSTNPYFSQEIGGNLEVKYITTGGNLQLPHNNSFSIPSVNGWYAYGFGPNLTLSGSAKTMPPASVVSNLFQAKYISGQPYKILAGPNDGAIRARNVSGVEYVFNETNDGMGDRDYLDPFGYNVIVNKSSGLQIYGNKTSQNTVNTPVSSIHSSEVLMIVQERINSMLENFVFNLNNSQNRLSIKQQADSICEEPLGAGAISGYVNVMDRSNNTDEIIENKIGILDTTLFDANGMEILVHRTTFDTRSNMANFEVLRSNL